MTLQNNRRLPILIKWREGIPGKRLPSICWCVQVVKFWHNKQTGREAVTSKTMSDKPEKLQELLTQGFITEQEYQSRLAALTTATNDLSLNIADENQQSAPKSNTFNFSFDNSSTTNSKNEQGIFSFTNTNKQPNESKSLFPFTMSEP